MTVTLHPSPVTLLLFIVLVLLVMNLAGVNLKKDKNKQKK